ncbi:hypothetical protein YC2023_072301 [Brassica napus]
MNSTGFEDLEDLLGFFFSWNLGNGFVLSSRVLARGVGTPCTPLALAAVVCSVAPLMMSPPWFKISIDPYLIQQLISSSFHIFFIQEFFHFLPSSFWFIIGKSPVSILFPLSKGIFSESVFGNGCLILFMDLVRIKPMFHIFLPAQVCFWSLMMACKDDVTRLIIISSSLT